MWRGVRGIKEYEQKRGGYKGGMMCVCVVDVYVDGLNESECSFGEKREVKQ